jgi:hypothetical protein
MCEKFNALGYSGTLITSPNVQVWLLGEEAQIFGAFGDEKINEAIEWLTMTVKGIPYADVRAYCKEHHPSIVIRRHNNGPGYETRTTEYKYIDEAQP